MRRQSAWQHAHKRRMRVLRTLYNRELDGLPAPTKEWFRRTAWDTVLDLAAEKLVVQFPNVKLTAAGRRFIRQHPAQGEAHQPDISADKQTDDEPPKS